jgi:hypothetical protein
VITDEINQLIEDFQANHNGAYPEILTIARKHWTAIMKLDADNFYALTGCAYFSHEPQRRIMGLLYEVQDVPEMSVR